MDNQPIPVDKSARPVDYVSGPVSAIRASDAGDLTYRSRLTEPGPPTYQAATASLDLREPSTQRRPYRGQAGSMSEDELLRAHGLEPW